MVEVTYLRKVASRCLGSEGGDEEGDEEKDNRPQGEGGGSDEGQ